MHRNISRMAAATSFLLASLGASATDGVCFYADYDYKGTEWCPAASEGNVTGTIVDKISAVRLPAGSKVTLYQHPDFTGKVLVLAADTPNLSNLAFNNLTSSYRVDGAPASPPVSQRKVLFVGNSFTHGEFEPAHHFNAANVTDLNGSGLGGVPGIFKQMTVDAGLSYDVAIEAVSGQTLQFHYQNELPNIGSKAWDVVVLQEYSTLDPASPLNPASFLKYSALLEAYVHVAGPNPNPAAMVYVLENWPRADQLYGNGNVWKGKSLEQAAAELHGDYQLALDGNARLSGMLPVGDAFAAAVVQGVADRNPFDGIDAGKVDPWNVDGYHASAFSSTLEAFIAFGRITGVDPRTLGANDAAAAGMGLTPAQTTSAESIAAQVLEATPARN